jgi:sec-independent protein translocase protein TatA
MGMIGTTELLVIMGVIVLLFGAKKLPALGGAIGESIKNFKKGINDNDPKSEEKDRKGVDIDKIE